MMKTELAQAVDQLLSDLRGLPFHLGTYEGDLQTAIDAEIARPKKKGEKSNRTAINAALDELLKYRKSIIADLEVAVDYCKEYSLPHSAVLKLIEALEGGFDCPKPEQFLYDARVEIQALRLAIEVVQADPDDSERQARGLELWNSGKTWPEVALDLDGNDNDHASVAMEIKRYAAAKDVFIREGAPGRPRKK